MSPSLATSTDSADRRETRAKPLILVVDDQPANIRVLYALLIDQYEVCMTVDSGDALALCVARQPDLILLDIVMPIVDGYALCRQLKANPATRDIPVIFVTGHLDPAEEVRGFAEGGVDFITKPFHASVVLARVRTQVTLKAQADLLRSLSYIDSLTGVANRRRFDEALVNESQRARRNGGTLALILIDVDFFKPYNDLYGHQRGDACLQAVAAELSRQVVRASDVVARYGGEEFACILPETPLGGAVQKAERIELAIRALAIAHAGSGVSDVVTVSLGVAVSDAAGDTDPAALLAAADAQLYRAKAEGRGRVSAAAP